MTSVVIHYASMVTVDPAYSEKLMAVNVTGTRNIITKCLAHPECEKMIYVSSTGAIPEALMGTKIKEVSKFEPNDPTKVVGAYSQSKAKEELGYTTRSYKETIHDEVEWLKQEGLI